MIDANLQERFAWLDVVEDGKCAGWGWSQNCTVREGRVEIECLRMPEIVPGQGMKLHIVAANHVTLINYIDTGFVLHEYVTSLSYDSVVSSLQRVQATPVHLVARELLGGLAKNGLLTKIFGNHRGRRGQRTH